MADAPYVSFQHLGKTRSQTAQITYQDFASSQRCLVCTCQRLDLLFYGDSILETFRGTSRGGPCARCIGGPEVFQQHFSSKYNSTVLAISGALRKPTL